MSSKKHSTCNNPSIILKKDLLSKNTLPTPFNNRASRFFKPSENIMTRVNTIRANTIRQKAYEKGSLGETIAHPISNKFHIKVKSEIEKSYNKDEIEKYREIDIKKDFGREYNTFSNKGRIVSACFDSSLIKGCLTMVTKNEKNEGITQECNKINAKAVNDFRRNNKVLANSNKKESVCSLLQN